MHCKHVIATIPSYNVKSYRTFYGMHLSVGLNPFPFAPLCLWVTSLSLPWIAGTEPDQITHT